MTYRNIKNLWFCSHSTLAIPMDASIGRDLERVFMLYMGKPVQLVLPVRIRVRTSYTVMQYDIKYKITGNTTQSSALLSEAERCSLVYSNILSLRVQHLHCFSG